MDSCPCHSRKRYEECCAEYHRGKKPDTALALMRSRYSAYALGLADYIIQTTHPSSSHFQPNQAQWKEQILQFSRGTVFEGLEILDFQTQEETAIVVFTARLRQQGKDASFTERSQFKKVDGVWTYLQGIGT